MQPLVCKSSQPCTSSFVHSARTQRLGCRTITEARLLIEPISKLLLGIESGACTVASTISADDLVTPAPSLIYFGVLLFNACLIQRGTETRRGDHCR